MRHNWPGLQRSAPCMDNIPIQRSVTAVHQMNRVQLADAAILQVAY